jgi:hypothetical protein
MSSISYIDWANETHSITNLAHIDITDNSPMIEETPNGILLQLFLQQRIMAKAILDAEGKRSVKTYMPKIKFRENIYDSSREGLLYSNIWRINMPVGSGKTAIVFAIIAKQRVPKDKTVIKGIDVYHSTIFYNPCEYAHFSKNDLYMIDQSVDWQCYLTTNDNKFPQYEPFSKKEFVPKNIIPTNLLFIATHLYDQVIGYCKEQITFKYEGIRGSDSLLDFSKRMIFGTIGDVPLIVIKLSKLETGHYAKLHTWILECLKEQKISITMRRTLEKALKNISTIKDASTYDLIQRLCYITNSEPIYFARVIYDDYDSLPVILTNKIPALTHIYISSTDIANPSRDFGPNRKMLMANLLRPICSATISPIKVNNILNLPSLRTFKITCSEGYEKIMVKYCLKGLYTLACLNYKIGDVLMNDKDKITHNSGLEELFDNIVKFLDVIDQDSSTTALMILESIDIKLRQYGVQISTYAKSESKKGTLVRAFRSIYKTYNSLRLYINFTQLSMKTLYGILNKDSISGISIGALNKLWMNFIQEFAYPKRTEDFKETMKIDQDYIYFMRNISIVKEPSSFTDLLSVMESYKNACGLLSPFVIKYMNNESHIKQINIMNITNILKMFLEEYEIVEKELNEVKIPSGTCSRCKEVLLYPFHYTNCCGLFICNNCANDTFVIGQADLQCKACSGIARNPLVTATFTDKYGTSCDDLVKIIIDANRKFSTSRDQNENMKTIMGHSPYVPMLYKLVKPMASKYSPNVKTGYDRTHSDKNSKIITIIKELRRKLKKNPIVLLYSKFVGEWQSFQNMLTKNNVLYSYFNSKETENYRNGVFELIICSSVESITGFNMEYIDCIIYYSKEKDYGIKTQIDGRALRINRKDGHELLIYELTYPSEEYFNPIVEKSRRPVFE